MNKTVLLLTLFGIGVGLLTGILDSFFQFIGYENNRYLSIFIFILFFIGVYISTSIFRNKLLDGFITFGLAFKNSFYIGMIATFVLSIIRFVYLKYISNLDLNSILDKTQQTMINHSESYKEELINNRLSFIEFSYDPFVSSTFYFLYYTLIALFFAFITGILLRKIDRDISLT